MFKLFRLLLYCITSTYFGNLNRKSKFFDIICNPKLTPLMTLMLADEFLNVKKWTIWITRVPSNI